MTVKRKHIEAQLEKLARECQDPTAGLYGPDSMMWYVQREAVTFLGAGRAGLLQAAHPHVAHGVDDHSVSRREPVARFERTFRHVFTMQFGSLEGALRSARTVHAMHTAVNGKIPRRTGAYDEGSTYRANEVGPLFWVAATLWDTSIYFFELLRHPLRADQKEAYYRDCKKFANLFGVADEQRPASWVEFMAYNERMWASDELAVGPVGMQTLQDLSMPLPVHLRPARDWMLIMTSGSLPPRVRHLYGMDFGWAERRVFDASVAALRASLRVTPARYRYLPAYHDAMRRIRGIEGRDPMSLMLDKAVERGKEATKHLQLGSA